MTRAEVIALVGRLDPGARVSFDDDGHVNVVAGAAMTDDGLAELWRVLPDARISFGPDSPLWVSMLEAMRSQDTSDLPRYMRAAPRYEPDDVDEDGTLEPGREPKP